MLGEPASNSHSEAESDSDSSALQAGRWAKDLANTQAIRAQEVFEQFLNERSRQAPSISVWATLLSSGKAFLLIGDVVDSMVEHGYAAASVGAPASVCGTFAGEAVANIVRMAEEIRSGRALRVTEPPDASDELRGASLTALSAPDLGASPEALRAASGLVFFADWLRQLDILLHEMESPVAETLAASRLPWWR
jgi:hypothetical protein